VVGAHVFHPLASQRSIFGRRAARIEDALFAGSAINSARLRCGRRCAVPAGNALTPLLDRLADRRTLWRTVPDLSDRNILGRIIKMFAGRQPAVWQSKSIAAHR